jgi:hypothetical protein
MKLILRFDALGNSRGTEFPRETMGWQRRCGPRAQAADAAAGLDRNQHTVVTALRTLIVFTGVWTPGLWAAAAACART